MRVRSCNDMFKHASLLALSAAQVAGGTSVTAFPTSSVPVVASPSTCPSGTINYITHSLPQQCLTSSWASKPATQSAADPITTSSVDVLASVLVANGLNSDSLKEWQTKPVLAEPPSPDTNSNSEPGQEQTSQPDTNTRTSLEAHPTGEANEGNDADSPLDNANFLSFEEWKIQNLAKAGQSVENLGSKDGGGRVEHGRRPGGINNALESLGEDSEIDLDFSGFGNAGGMNDALPVRSAMTRSSATKAEEVTKANIEESSSPHRQNKDAGKTCKERSNYASFDCAATALKSNPECKGATSVLVESKDSYMLNVCSAKNKFFIVELCDVILIDTIVLANFEYFSSMFRTFRVSVSDRYPEKIDKWKDLGTFEARNSREIQAFLVENPLIWARYLRIEFLTHYGAEYYCPVSLLRVHGTTMMEEFNHEQGARGEDEVELETGESDNEHPNQTPDPVSAERPEIVSQVITELGEAIRPVALTSTLTPTGGVVSEPRETIHKEDDVRGSLNVENFTPYSMSIGKEFEDMRWCKKDHEQEFSHISQLEKASTTSLSWSTTAYGPPSSSQLNEVSSAKADVKMMSREARLSPEQTTTASASSQSGSSTLQAPPANSDHTTLSADTTRDTLESSKMDSIMANPIHSNGGSSKSSVRPNSTSLAQNTIGPSSSSAISTVRTSSTQSPVANPSTQESFFKSVHKRLQQLEVNSTLSLQYTEEQSRILRDAFSKVEKRQLSKTSTFLESLNTTVLNELRAFRMQYDQIWQSTVLELSSQRERSAQEVSVLSARMAFLADEVTFQKRMAMIQFMLILLCLGFVIFSRYGGPSSTYLELPPLMQTAISRSSANLARYTHFETPPASPPSTRPPSTGTSSDYGLFRRRDRARSPSDEFDVNIRPKSPNTEYSTPTPDSQTLRNARNASPGSPSGDESEDTLSFDYPLLSSHDTLTAAAAAAAKSSPPAIPNGVQEEGHGKPRDEGVRNLVSKRPYSHND